MIIYLIENKINGKKYVGQTITDLAHRFQRGHLSEARTGRRTAPLYQAIRKYGENNFKASVLEECSSQEELNKQEKYWIQKFNTLVPTGYNLLEGGESKIHRQDTKDKISNILRKRIAEGLIPGFTGKTHSEITRKILSEKSKGNTNAKSFDRDEEWRAKQRASHLGKKLSEETKRKIGESSKGRRHSEETKHKLSEMRKGENHPNFGKTTSTETKQKMSAALSGKNNPFYGKQHSEETKRKMREAHKHRRLSSMS